MKSIELELNRFCGYLYVNIWRELKAAWTLFCGCVAMKLCSNLMSILNEMQMTDTELLVYTMTLINKVLTLSPTGKQQHCT